MAQTSTRTLVYLLISKDDYDIDQMLFFLKERMKKESEPISEEIYHRDEADLSRILDSALNMPMFARKKLIVMKYASALLANDIPYLLEYLKNPPAQTILLITAKEWLQKGEVRERFEKCFRKVPVARLGESEGKALWIVLPSKSKREAKATVWIQKQCEQKGLRMEEGALDLFYEICGKDKLTMQSEIEKLASFKGNGNKVTKEDITRIAAENKVFDVYALLASICQQKPAKAVEILRRLLDSRKGHPFIIWHLDNFFSKLAIAKTALQSGASDNEAAEKAGIRFYKDQFVHNAKIARSEVIMKAPACIFNADRMMKSGFREEIILEKLILDLA